MRFNKQELITLASQPSHKFDREGILILKERQDGFFRRTESTKSDHSKSQKDGKREKLKSLSCVGVSDKVSLERWCRLRGNLLFYLRAAEQWAEPLGVIVLEQCSVRTSPEDHSGHWPFQIVWDGGTCQQMAALTEADRIGWLQAIQLATYECMRSQMLALLDRLEKKRGTDPDIDIHMWRLQKGLTMDINEVPLCELSLSCDNLLCDAHGQPPSPLLVIHIKTVSDYWIRYSSTEVIEKSSNPSFFSTVSFRGSDSLDGNTKVRVTVYDMREKVSNTAVPMGSAVVLLSTIQDTQRLRIPLTSRESSTIGFLTLNGWSLEPSNHGSSPQHTSDLNGAKGAGTTSQRLFSHRRSQSLPPRLGVKLKLPSHGLIMKHICANPYQVTYRFHSGLGGDITVHEIMAESKLCFTLPQQLLSLWIQREKELLQEVLCMGELGGPWRARQTELLDTHLSLLKYYSHARQNLQNHSTTINSYKQSSRKADPYLEFAPVNLHIQRMWVHNDTLSKSGFYDLITVGAFTAHCQKFGRSGGLLRLVQQMKNIPPQKDVSVPSLDSRIHMASDAVHAIKQLRGEVVSAMRGLLTLAKARQPAGMMPLADQMVAKTRALLSLWDPGQVEEALAFIDKHKLTPAQDLEDTKNTRPKVLSPFKQLTQQLSLLDLKSPEIEDFATPSTPQNQWPNPVQNIPTILSSSLPNYASIFNAQNFAEKSKNGPSPDNNTNPLLPKHSPKNGDNELSFHHQYFVDDSDERLRLGQFRSYNYCIDENAECTFKSDNSHNFAFANLKNDSQFASLNIKQSFDISTQKSNSSTIESGLTVNDKNSIQSNFTPVDLDGNGALISGEDYEELQCASFSDESGILGCNNDFIAKQFLDIHAMSSSPSANYYQPNDEPEPWDLTQLNVEASVMCLVSKVKFLCGRCGSPAVRLRGQSVSMSACSSGFKRVSKSGIHSGDKNIVTNQPHTGKSSSASTSILSETIRNNIRLDKLSERAEINKTDETAISPEYTHIPLKGGENISLSNNGDKTKQKIASSAVTEADDALNKTVESVNRVMKKGNKFTDGLVLADVSDWAAELRPSMRKLRQAMDGLLKGGRLAHAVLRVRGPSQQQAVALQLRRDVCFSQALTSLITGLVCWVWSTDPETIGALLKAGMGPLCCVQGLLSLHGAELPMWGDMLIAVEDLRTVLFQLATWDHRRNVMPQISGSRFSIVVTIPAPANVYAQLPNKQNASFTITPVFFNIGINEKATIAESFGSTGPQDRSNADNFERLNEYYLRFRKLSLSSNHVITRVSSGLRPLVEIMESLKSAVYSRTSKNVEVLHLSSHAVRQMNGIRMTSCKSAKDRTGMSCTLEQCQILATEYHLAEHEFNRALDCMRSEGCRRENTYKNTGVRKYAFNKLQIMSLPKAYRPPSGTYGSAQT